MQIPAYKDRLLTYEKLWNTCKIERRVEVDLAVEQIKQFKAQYQKIERITTVPAHVVGIIHYMESSSDFRTHLFNGDPLTARTVHVPKGQPKLGLPPFTWEESAVAAIEYNQLNKWQDWTISGICYALESYNGWGYFPTKIYSPYLWSFTNHYQRGKYTSDGVFDPAAISRQAGVCAIVRRMLDLNLLAMAPLWV
jgi:lysozyme family protein